MDRYPADPIEQREFDAVHGHDEREREFDRDLGEYHLPRGVRRPAALVEQEDEGDLAA